jgi:LCP family protein required for cell wall assembly
MTQNSVQGEETRPGVPRTRRTRREVPSRNGGQGGGDTGAQGGGRHGRRRAAPARKGRRVLRWSASTLAVLILGTAGAGYLYYQHLNGNIDKGERSSGGSQAQKTKPNAAGQTPLNILLIGSDSRASDANVELGGSRDHRNNPPLGDVQMLIHLAADRKSAAVVSIPRDTRVDIPKCTDPKTDEAYPAVNTIINTSLARGGAGCTLATWQNLTGVYIDHWMTIDFAGVVSMADAVGGVEVCVNQNVYDKGGSGLKMKAGRKEVQGKQALQWLRTRHAWGSDPLRARAQHMYMNSMIRKLKNQNVFTDGGRLMDLAEAATKSLTVSEEIGTVKKLYDLGMQLKSVPTDRITMTTMPNIEDPEDRNHLLPEPAGAEKMWKMLRDDVPFDDKGTSKKTTTEKASKDPAADDDKIGVLVQNATKSDTLAAVDGRARVISELLVQKGFPQSAADTSGTLAEDRTVVRYPSADLEGDAQRIAKSLGIPLSSVKKSTEVSGVTLVVGADWREGTTYPKQSDAKAGDLPTNSDELNGADSSKCMDVYKYYQW